MEYELESLVCERADLSPYGEPKHVTTTATRRHRRPIVCAWVDRTLIRCQWAASTLFSIESILHTRKLAHLHLRYGGPPISPFPLLRSLPPAKVPRVRRGRSSNQSSTIFFQQRLNGGSIDLVSLSFFPQDRTLRYQSTSIAHGSLITHPSRTATLACCIPIEFPFANRHAVYPTVSLFHPNPRPGGLLSRLYLSRCPLVAVSRERSMDRTNVRPRGCPCVLLTLLSAGLTCALGYRPRRVMGVRRQFVGGESSGSTGRLFCALQDPRSI